MCLEHIPKCCKALAYTHLRTTAGFDIDRVETTAHIELAMTKIGKKIWTNMASNDLSADIFSPIERSNCCFAAALLDAYYKYITFTVFSIVVTWIYC